MTQIPYWPDPIDDDLVRKYEATRAAILDRLARAGALSPEEVGQVEAIVTDMNASMAQLFASFVEPAARADTLLDDGARLAYLEQWSAAREMAEAQIARINDRMPDAVDSAAFVAQSMMDIANLQRHRTFQDRFQKGTAAGFVGCAEGPPDLSKRYKEELASSLNRKL